MNEVSSGIRHDELAMCTKRLNLDPYVDLYVDGPLR
jgi:hypothetical protein